jgi:uncharacterized protein GlcG (DUF336 family)
MLVDTVQGAGAGSYPKRGKKTMISRNYWIAVGLGAFFVATGVAKAQPVLTVTDVTTVVRQAAQATPAGVNAIIAVSDREGFILAVYGVKGTPTTGELPEVNAIDKAGTAAYLSSGGEAFTSRTAGFIIQPHFPPGIGNTGTGPLTGVGLSSLPFSDINHFRNPTNPAAGIANTSLSGNPGGVPLYKGSVLVGAVGVDSNAILSALVYVGGSDLDESIALAGQAGYTPPSGILATQVLINGIRVPYVNSGVSPSGSSTYNPANYDTNYEPTASTGKPFQAGGVATPIPILPVPAPLTAFPGGEVRDPIIGSTGPPISGQPRLSQAEVTTILYQGALRASQTRGAIRNPIGPAEVFIVVMDYYTVTGGVPQGPYGPLPITTPYTAFPRKQVLGSFRTPDATLFSYDVAAQKARTALFFSNNSIALSARGVGFLSQGTYPPGIDGTVPGPYGPPTYGASNPSFGMPNVTIFPLPFGIQTAVSVLPLGGIPTTPINPYLVNGITVFPGGFPLYRNGVLIGAVGVSGDGVDQDDLITAAATVGFEAPNGIRSDQYTFRGARLPYAKFPQNASL